MAKGWTSFSLPDQASCESAIRTGGIVALISAAIGLAFGAAGFFTSSDHKALNYLLDPWILLDAALLVVIGIFVLRKSRVAATLLLVYFIVSKVMMWIELEAAPGLLISFMVLVVYVNAMRATFKWHAQYAPGAADVSDPPAVNTRIPPAASQHHTAGQPNFCVHCGTRVLPEARFCVSCGAEVTPVGVA
jgi:hypothetical protein